MDPFLLYGNLLQASGTNQLQRNLPALETGYILPDERSLPDLIAYARELAAQIRFYNLSGQAVGDWRPFFEPLVNPDTGAVRSTQDLEAEMASSGSWSPHTALYLVFLKLFRHLQDDLNELPARHLRHYYESELELLRRGALADEVHVVFELARTAQPTKLDAGTRLVAGKDSEGRPLVYTTDLELVISAATVGEIRRLVAEVDRRGNRRFLAAEAVAEIEGPSWYTFGGRQLELDPSQRFMTEARLGFAVASPLLRMTEGTRVVTVRAFLHNPAGSLPTSQAIDSALAMELTGADGWVVPDSFSASLNECAGNALECPTPLTLDMEFTLGEAAPAIVPLDPEVHGDGPVSEWPVLRCTLNGEDGRYETLDDLIVQRASIEVDVTGVRNLIVQNDQGTLIPDQPMALFGSQPRLGSTFYIGSAEAFAKPLTALTLTLDWQDPPDPLYDHYAGYFDTPDANLEDGFQSSFVCDIDLLYERSWSSLQTGQPLFETAIGDSRRIDITEVNFRSALGQRVYEPPVNVNDAAYGANSRHGFARLVLRGPTQGTDDSAVPFKAFGHGAFTRRYATQALALARWDDTSTDAEPVLPNEPYTPTLTALSLGYHARTDFVPGDLHGPHAWFVAEPWGYTAASADAPARLVPEIDGEAALYVGIDKLLPPANVSLFFEIDTGTASAADVLSPGETCWSYLSGDVWVSLPGESVLSDSTYGFQQPGIVVLTVDRIASTDHNTMPGGLVWLRAVIDRPPDSASRTIALSAQAAMARLSPETGSLDDYAQHLGAGLAAGSIKRLEKRVAAIKAVNQPYPSFGGRGPEPDTDFFRRSSERLRHRNRAVTAWDFERLVLEGFPEMFKVKCLPHSDAEGNEQPGEVAIVVVPDLRNTQSTNPLEPRAGAVSISRIEDYLAANVSSSFARVHVIHPVHEQLLVDARVAFRLGLDAGYYANQLDTDLQRFLSPWAFEEGVDIAFGARIYKSELLAFMEGRDYVDFVVEFELYHRFDGPARDSIGQMTIGEDFFIRPGPRRFISGGPDGMIIGNNFVIGRGVEVAEASRRHAILVSHAQHRIRTIGADEDLCVGVTRLGIGNLTVGLDFRVSPAS